MAVPVVPSKEVKDEVPLAPKLPRADTTTGCRFKGCRKNGGPGRGNHRRHSAGIKTIRSSAHMDHEDWEWTEGSGTTLSFAVRVAPSTITAEALLERFSTKDGSSQWVHNTFMHEFLALMMSCAVSRDSRIQSYFGKMRTNQGSVPPGTLSIRDKSSKIEADWNPERYCKVNLSNITIAAGSIQGSQVCLVPVQINISDCAEKRAALVSNLKTALTDASWLMPVGSAVSGMSSDMPAALRIQGDVAVAQCKFERNIRVCFASNGSKACFKPKDQCVGDKCQSKVAEKQKQAALDKAARGGGA